MPTFNRVNTLSQNLSNKILDMDSDTFRWILTNSAPSAANALLSDITQIATGGNYTQMTDGAGGLPATLSMALSTAQMTISLAADVTLTASGSVATFRYAVLVDDTPTSPLNPLIGWIDHGAGITMAATDTYKILAGALFTVG